VSSLSTLLVVDKGLPLVSINRRTFLAILILQGTSELGAIDTEIQSRVEKRYYVSNISLLVVRISRISDSKDIIRLVFSQVFRTRLATVTYSTFLWVTLISPHPSN